VLLEGVEVADGGRLRDRRPQADVRERVLGDVSAARGEPVGQRRSVELDDPLALDPAGREPAGGFERAETLAARVSPRAATLASANAYR
jgi:hypothetical protein